MDYSKHIRNHTLQTIYYSIMYAHMSTIGKKKNNNNNKEIHETSTNNATRRQYVFSTSVNLTNSTRLHRE